MHISLKSTHELYYFHQPHFLTSMLEIPLDPLIKEEWTLLFLLILVFSFATSLMPKSLSFITSPSSLNNLRYCGFSKHILLHTEVLLSRGCWMKLSECAVVGDRFPSVAFALGQSGRQFVWPALRVVSFINSESTCRKKYTHFVYLKKRKHSYITIL